MIQSLRQTVRSLLRAPTFTAVAVVTLSLGIGATTSVLSIVDSVLVRALPYRDVKQLAMVLEMVDVNNQRLPSYLAFKDFRSAALANPAGPIRDIAFMRGNGAILRTETGVERTIAWWVTPGFFRLMGTAPLLGRVFDAADETASANRVAVISHRFWTKRFAKDSTIIGRVVNLDAAPITIIGVMPPEFEYPAFADDFWVPIADIEGQDIALSQRGMHVDSRTIARLRSAGDSGKAAAALSVVASQLAESYPNDAAHYTHVSLSPITNELLGGIKPTLMLLLGAASLVLLLGCINVATLSLVRASIRARELAVRAALGATRRHLIGALFAEGALLGAIGAAGGIALAFAIVRGVRRWAAADLPRADALTIDGRVLLIALVVSLLAMVLTSLIPAWRASRFAVGDQLHGGQRGAAGNRRDTQLRGALVALQFGFAVMLLVGAGLLMQSFRRLNRVDVGYDENRISTVAIFPPANKYTRPDDALAFFHRLRDAVKQVPGVQNVALMNHAPGGGITTRVAIPGRMVDPSQQDVLYGTASVEYLATLGAHVTTGRWFTDEDMRSPAGGAIVINETMARRFWPNESAIGRNLTLHRASSGRPDVGEPLPGTVVGVVADMHSFGKDSPVPAEAWVPNTREVWGWITLLVRSENPESVAPALRKAILAVDPNIPLDAGPTGGVSTPARGSNLNRRELALAMVTAFSGCALVLAAIGLYGVVAYSVTQRTREVGIRMALGATNRSIAQLVLGGAMKVVAIGLIIGLLGAFAGTRVIKSLLFDTASTDIVTYLTVPVVLCVVALLASWWPTRRAVRVSPTIAMRAE